MLLMGDFNCPDIDYITATSICILYLQCNAVVRECSTHYHQYRPQITKSLMHTHIL